MSESDELGRLCDERREKPLNERSMGAETTETSAQTPQEPVHIDGLEDFEMTLDQSGVVLVDFYADWCGPCKMIAPVVEELAAEAEATVAKVDVDVNGRLVQQYRVQGVPTLLLFSGGEPVERVVGVRSKDELAGLIARYA